MSIGLTPFLSFEPIHGSASRYEGKGMVNAVASIESVKMMLDHLGKEEAIHDIEKAVSKILFEGKFKTLEMGGEHSAVQNGRRHPKSRFGLERNCSELMRLFADKDLVQLAIIELRE